MRWIKPVILGMGVLLLVLLALAALERPLLFCWPTFLLALAGLILLVTIALVRPAEDRPRGADRRPGTGDRGMEAADRAGRW